MAESATLGTPAVQTEPDVVAALAVRRDPARYRPWRDRRAGGRHRRRRTRRSGGDAPDRPAHPRVRPAPSRRTATGSATSPSAGASALIIVRRPVRRDLRRRRSGSSSRRGFPGRSVSASSRPSRWRSASARSASCEGSNPDFLVLGYDPDRARVLLGLVGLVGASMALVDAWLDRRLPRPLSSIGQASGVYIVIALLGSFFAVGVVATFLDETLRPAGIAAPGSAASQP